MIKKLKTKHAELASLFSKARPFLVKGTYRIAPSEKYFWLAGTKKEAKHYGNTHGVRTPMAKRFVLPFFFFKSSGGEKAFGRMALISPLGKITIIGEKTDPVAYVFPDFESRESIEGFFRNYRLIQPYLFLPQIIWTDEEDKAFATSFIEGQHPFMSITDLLGLLSASAAAMIEKEPASVRSIAPKKGSLAFALTTSPLPYFLQHGDVHKNNLLAKPGEKPSFIDFELLGFHPAGFDMLSLILEPILEGRKAGEKSILTFLEGSYDSYFGKVFTALKTPFGQEDRDKYLAFAICEVFDRYEGKVQISRAGAEKRIGTILETLPLETLPWCKKLDRVIHHR